MNQTKSLSETARVLACGALTGRLMAMGMKYGTNEPSAEKQKAAYKLAETLCRQFEKKMRLLYAENSLDSTCQA